MIEDSNKFNLEKCISNISNKKSSINLNFKGYQNLLPKFDSKFTVNGKSFKSPEYYVYLKLYSILPKYTGMNEVYDIYGNYFSIDKIKEYYIDDRFKITKNYMRSNLRKALEIKFEDVYITEILKLSAGKNLVYNNRNSFFDRNYIGKEIMKIRREKMSMPPLIYGDLTVRNSDAIIANDPFFKNWAKMRISDYQNNIKRFYNFLEMGNLLTSKSSIEAKNEVSMLVLKHLYNPLNLISTNSFKFEKTNVPEYFQVMYNEVSSFRDVSVMKVTYVYIITLMNYMTSLKIPEINELKKVLFNTQINMSRGKPVCAQISGEDEDDELRESYKCVPMAYYVLQNIIFKIKAEFTDIVEFSNEDLKLIESIILSKSYPDKKRPIVDTTEIDNKINETKVQIEQFTAKMEMKQLEKTQNKLNVLQTKKDIIEGKIGSIIKFKEPFKTSFINTYKILYPKLTEIDFVDIEKSMNIVATTSYQYKTNHLTYYSGLDI